MTTFKPIFENPLENVVAHSPAESGVYLGSPSLTLDEEGGIVVSHDLFGPGCPRDRFGREYSSRILRSDDDGETWTNLADIPGAFWSTIFSHRGSLYLLGCSAHYGDIAIRRSDDGGGTWTDPVDEDSGLLYRGGDGVDPPNYHCAPVPVVEHRGRLWRAFEDDTPHGWPNFLSTAISSDAGSDLLKASSWKMTNKLPYDPETDPPEFGHEHVGWLEGNVVQSPGGDIWNLLRVNSVPVANRAALAKVSRDGSELTFDPGRGFIDFPGGMSKFQVRLDPGSGRYIALANEMFNPPNPWQRNVLAIARSDPAVCLRGRDPGPQGMQGRIPVPGLGLRWRRPADPLQDGPRRGPQLPRCKLHHLPPPGVLPGTHRLEGPHRAP
jgi:hypothetical protein